MKMETQLGDPWLIFIYSSLSLILLGSSIGIHWQPRHRLTLGLHSQEPP